MDAILAGLIDGAALAAHLVDSEAGDVETEAQPDARAIRLDGRRRMARVRQRDALRDVLPTPPAPGEQYHIISSAKWDFWTWVPAMIQWLGGRTDSLYCSTWTASRAGITELFELCDAGKIGSVGFLTGLYFKRRESAVYATLLGGLRRRGHRYRAFPNHAKILLLRNEARGDYLSIEGSANLTSNPRTEQYCITNDQALWTFYRDWFEESLAKIKEDKEAGKT